MDPASPSPLSPAAADHALVSEAHACGEVVDDLLRGLIDLRAGILGSAPPRRWGGSLWRQGGSIAKQMSHVYGDEQLRKATVAARELVAAVDSLRGTATPTARALVIELDQLAAGNLAVVLNDPATTVGSAGLDDAFERLQRAMAALGRARVRLSIEASRPQAEPRLLPPPTTPPPPPSRSAPPPPTPSSAAH